MPKKFDPLKVISQEDFSKLFIVEDGQVDVGTIIPDYQHISTFCKAWCKKMDIFLQYEHDKREYSKIFQIMIAYRGITFQEFMELFNPNILENDFDNHIAFMFLQIENNVQKHNILAGLSETKEEAYTQLLKNTEFHKIQDFFFEKLPARLRYKDLLAHTYLSGSSGSGKSEFLRLFAYEFQQHYPNASMLVIDPHGDLAKQIAYSDLNINNDRLVFIDPNLQEGYTPVFNPFEVDTSDPEEVDVLGQYMQEVIQEMLGEEVSNVVLSVLHPVICTLMFRKGSTFADLARFFDPEKNADLVEAGLNSPIWQHREPMNRIKTGYFSKSRDAISSRVQNFLNKTIFYRMVVGKSSIDLKKMLNSNKIVIFSLPLGQVGNDTLEFVGRFLIAQIVNIGLRRSSIPIEYRPHTFVIIDEASNFITKSLAKAYDQLRKYGVHMILASQYARQLSEVQDSILANSNVKIIGFNNDKDTYTRLTHTSGLHFSDMEKIKPLEFYIKVSATQGYKIKARSKLIDGSHTLSWQEISDLNKKQVSKYYTPIQFESASPPNSQPPAENKDNPSNKGNNKKPPYSLHIPDDITD